MIELTINGAPHTFQQKLNMSELLEKMNLTGKRVAIERNGEIVPRSQFGEVQLASGDQLEIVVAVGGG